MEQRPVALFLLSAFLVKFSGTQPIYQDQNDWSSKSCENDHQILRGIRSDVNELTHLVRQLHNKELGLVNNVAFYAQLTTPVTDDYVIFNHVITNEGAAYKSSGIFTCQFGGTYVFSWTIASSQNHQTRADLLVNDISLGSTATYSRGSGSDDLKGSSTGFVVYDLQVGDKVRVILNGSALAEFSTFSGWKLQHDTLSFYARASTNLTSPDIRDSGYKFQNVLTNNGGLYNPDNGVITIPDTGIWALTISVETTRSFDSLNVGRSIYHPRVYVYSEEDTASFLLIMTLSLGDRLYWHSSYNTTLLPVHSAISGWLIGPINARPTFMAAADTSTIPSPVNFTREYLDLANSLSGTDYRASKSGVYLIFLNAYAKRLLETTLLINGRTITSTRHQSSRDHGSNVAILRLQKDDVVTVETNAASDYVSISGYFLF